MKSRIIEICELGQPQSIIHRENAPITELIKTDSLIEELNEQLLLYSVVGQSEQLAQENERLKKACQEFINSVELKQLLRRG